MIWFSVDALLGHSDEVKNVKTAIESAHQDTVTKLQRETKQLKHINQDLQTKYQTKQQDYRDKVQMCIETIYLF